MADLFAQNGVLYCISSVFREFIPPAPAVFCSGLISAFFFNHRVPIKTYGKEQFNGETLESGEHLNKSTEVKRWAAHEGLR